jgi:hypothetical protein
MFYSMTAFDMHRTGSYTGHHTRRCLSAKEMRAKGMRANNKGVWSTGRFAPSVGQMELWPVESSKHVA